MLRYIKEAFWARPSLWGLGAIPWNALGVAGAAILGVAVHAIWPLALGAETLYLYVLATNPRFQQWVDSKDLQRIHHDDETSRTKLMQTLGTPAKQRLNSLDDKINRIENLYKESQNEDYLFDSNRDALEKLQTIYLRLLVAQRNIVNTTGADERQLKEQIASLQRDLASAQLSPALRESKQATLQLCTQRLKTMQRREETLAEIDSDLTRIDTQIDLAVEDASLKGRPTAISANIDLVSHLLDDGSLDEVPPASTTSRTTTTTSNRQMEN